MNSIIEYLYNNNCHKINELFTKFLRLIEMRLDLEIKYAEEENKL